MKKLYIIFTLPLLLTFLGCTENFLEEVHPTRTTSETFFTKDDDVNQAVIGLYAYLETFYGTNADNFMGCFDILRGDELTLPRINWNNGVVNWLTLNYNPETVRVRDAWQQSYTTIYRANWIIDNITSNAAISEGVKKKALSEAYFMRGFCYFNLTRYFEEVPLILQQSKPENYYPTKATNEECWNQVFADFQKALDLGGLPAPTSNFMDDRINTGVVNAIMARAYLLRTRPGNTQYWDKVKQYCDLVEKLNAYDLEPIASFRKIFVYSKGDLWVKNKEMIWAAPNIYGPTYGGLPFIYRNQSNLGTGSTMPVTYCPTVVKNEKNETYLPGNGRTGRALYAVSTSFSDEMISSFKVGDNRISEILFYPSFNHYKLSNSAVPTSVTYVKKVNTDSLYQKLIESNGTQGEFLHIQKYQIQEFVGSNIWDGGWNHPLLFPIIRYADILLMRAEAEYNLGNAAVAKTYLKKITDRAGLPANYTDAFNGQQLLDEILKQRRIELFFEGTRVPDLIRLNLFKPPYVGSYPGSVSWNEKYSVLPIPQRELDLNKNLIQHELWR